MLTNKRRAVKRYPWFFILVVLMSGSFVLLVLKSRNNNANHNHYVRLASYKSKATDSVNFVSSTVPNRKHVTKSLTDLGKMDEINKNVVFLNRVPHSGGELLVFLLQKLQGFNNYRHVRLKDKFLTSGMSQSEQGKFVDNFFEILRKEAVPLSFDQQIRFVNFTSFGRQSPTFISLIREPTDQILTSTRKRFMRYSNANNDLATCLMGGSYKKCEVPNHLLSISYLCGHNPECWLNRKWALQVAKDNVEKYYPVVGVLEEFNATLEILEYKVPYFFKGAQDFYKNNVMGNARNKMESANIRISKKIRSRLRDLATEEYDFYEWVKRRLFQQLQILYGEHNHH